MNNTEIYYDTKKGRPSHEQHKCDTCQKTYKNATTLASHKQDAKKGKVKCLPPPPSFDDGLIINTFKTSSGSKSMLNKLIPQIGEYRQELPQGQEQSSTTSAETAIILETKLKNTNEWKQVDVMFQSQDFTNIPERINESFAHSFLIYTKSITEYHFDFLAAFVKVVSFLRYNPPKHLMEHCLQFLSNFKPTNQHELSDITSLYEFTKKLGCCWEWFKDVQQAAIVIARIPTLTEPESGPLSDIFAQQIDLYSSTFFQTYDKVMSHPSLQRCFYIYIENFFRFVNKGTDKIVTYDLLLAYKTLWTEFPKENVDATIAQIRQKAQQQLLNEDVLALAKLVFKYGKELVLTVLSKRQEIDSISDLVGRIEDMIIERNERQKIEQQKEELKQSEMQRQKELKEKEEEENKIAAEQQQKQQEENQQLELQKQQLILEQQQLQVQEEQKLKDARLQIYQELCLLNNVAAIDDKTYFEFVETMVGIAAQLPQVLVEGVLTTIAPRAEQLAVMYLLLTSQHQITLIQLATGAGKSLMLGILAWYLNKTTGKKVIVVVPTSFLHAYQQHNYCPNASNIPDKMGDPTAKHIFYSDFNRFSAPEFTVPADTILLVDEFHELFFDQWVQLIDGKVISVLSKLLSAERVIGVSATYRGENGADKINSLLQDSIFIKSPQELQEKKLDLEVFGRISSQDIIPKAIALAQEKAQIMPVIIFCNDPAAMKQQMQEALVFVGDEVGELNAVLKFLKTSSNTIVLTSSADSKGVDFVFSVPQAFIIHTTLPKSLVQLKQDSGRGVRGNNLPIVGALFTEKTYYNLEDVELGLAHAEQFDKLYPADYLQSLQYLERLPTPTTDPQVKALNAAAFALNQGKSFANICFILSKSAAFKKAMAKEFIMPVPPKQLLGKRSPPQVYEEEKSRATSQQQPPAKIQATGQAVIISGCQHLECKRASFFTVCCESCKTKTKDAWQCIGCKKYVCSPCHERIVATAELEPERSLIGALGDITKEDQETMHPDASMSNHQVGELREAVVEDLERQQYQALHAKFGGQQQSGSGTASPQSKTSSQMLGLDREEGNETVSESSVGIHRPAQKRRDQKAYTKNKEQETQSVKSGGSKCSKRSVKKGTVVINEGQWKELKEKDKYRNALYQCTHRGCSYKAKKGDRWKHVCQYKP